MAVQIAGVCFVRRGQLVTVRKKGTARFMLVGGKIEAGETPIEAACREVSEETPWTREPDQLVELGEFDSPAANEPGQFIHSTVFLADEPTESEWEQMGPRAEIEQIHLLDICSETEVDLAPLLQLQVLPLLRTRYCGA